MVSLSATAQIELLDKVIAIVDDDVVLQSELNQRVATVYTQIQQSGTQPPPQDILLQQVLDRLISERLQLNIAYSAGVRIPDEELNVAMERIAAGNKITMEQYAEQIHAQGQTVANVREEIRNELTLMRVQQGKVMRRICLGLHIGPDLFILVDVVVVNVGEGLPRLFIECREMQQL